MSEEHYEPAKRPPGETSSRVRFENEGGIEQSLFGGSAKDIAESIIADTRVNTRIIGQKIISVTTGKADLGAGDMNELIIRLSNGTDLRINGIQLEVRVDDE